MEKSTSLKAPSTMKQKICQFYVSRKKRQCRMLAKTGNKYCGQHMVESNEPDSNGHLRIPCPLDPKHSCYSHQLEQHLLACNAKEPTHLPYYNNNINGGCNDQPTEGQKEKIVSLNSKNLSELTDDQLMKLINLVLESRKDEIDEIPHKQMEHPSMVEEIQNSKEKCGPNLLRHLIQNSSLISHIDVIRRKLKKSSSEEKEPTTFIEFGAGRGQLSHWLSVGFPPSEELRILMIDRGAQRYKCDSKMAEKSNVTQHRIRLDIADLDLQKVDTFKMDEGIHLAGGKHICGAATDLSLRCLVGSGVMSGAHRAGLVMALCCHHRCSWQPYVGKTFLMSLGLSETEFPALLGLTSWAVCGARLPKGSTGGDSNTKEDQKEDDSLYSEHEVTPEDEGIVNRYQRLGLSISQRETIGLAAKALINRGRVSYLTEKGLEASLVYYVPKELTLENVALIASKKIDL